MTAGAPDWERVVVGPGGSSVGGYASLTGSGQTSTPGDLTQAGGFEVNCPGSDGSGIIFDDAGGGGIIFSETGSGGGISVLDASGAGISIKESAAGSHAGVSIIDQSDGGINLSDSATGSGGVNISDHGTGGLNLSTSQAGGNGNINIDCSGGGGIGLTGDVAQGVTWRSNPSYHSSFFAADVLGNLPTPIETPGWGFTADGHIYFYPAGGPWALKV